MLDQLISSRFFGRPIELYEFSYGPLLEDTYRYTDADYAITYLGQTFWPMTISRGSTGNTGSLDKTLLEVKLPHTSNIAQMYRIYPPSQTVGLTILQGQGLDPDGEFVAIWVGRVISVAFEGIEAKVSGEPISTSFRRSGLRRNYQYMCPHVLYGPQCKASRAAATVTSAAASVAGREVALTGALSRQAVYAGGIISWVGNTGLPEARTILEVRSGTPGPTLVLSGLANSLAPGSTVSLAKGCLHTLPSCRDEHSNAPNFGGDPWIPLKNPIGNVSPY